MDWPKLFNWVVTLTLKNHRLIIPSSPHDQCCFDHTKKPVQPADLQVNIEWRERGGKYLCNLVLVSMQKNGEICAHFAFVSTSFVHDCSLQACHSNNWNKYCLRQLAEANQLAIYKRSQEIIIGLALDNLLAQPNDLNSRDCRGIWTQDLRTRRPTP